MTFMVILAFGLVCTHCLAVGVTALLQHILFQGFLSLEARDESYD